MNCNKNGSFKAKKYSAWKTRLFILSNIVALLSILVFQVFFSSGFSEALSGLKLNFYVSLECFVAVFFLFLYFCSLPLHYIGSFVIEHRYSLSRQTFKEWIADELKSGIISFIIISVCIQVLYMFLRNFTDIWWILAAISWVLFSVVMARLMPVVVLPLFYRYSPIPDGALRKRIIGLAEKAGIKLIDVCQINFSAKTSKSNAALIGLGRSRKVVLADNLIKEFDEREIAAVLAHEFGHFKHRHMWRLLFFSAVSTFIVFFVLHVFFDNILRSANASNIYDIKLLPLIVLFIGALNFIVLPVQNFYSRCLERKADGFSLDLTGDTDHFISMMVKLADKNLADMSPSKIKKFFFYSHPPIYERIEMAEKYTSP